MTKMTTTSKQAEFNYKLPHNSNRSLLQPTKSPRRGPFDWETCGMNGKSCLVWAGTVMRMPDHTEICTHCYRVLYETIVTREFDHWNNALDPLPVLILGTVIPVDDAVRSCFQPSSWGSLDHVLRSCGFLAAVCWRCGTCCSSTLLVFVIPAGKK